MHRGPASRSACIEIGNRAIFYRLTITVTLLFTSLTYGIRPICIQTFLVSIRLSALLLFACFQGSASAATVHQVCSDLIVIEVPTTTYGWQSTGINITANSKWYFTVQGIANVAWTVDTINWDRWATPGGEPARLPINLTNSNILVATAPVGSLVARIGGTTLYLGGGGAIPPPYDTTPPSPGQLELGYNDTNSQGNINSFLGVPHALLNAGDAPPHRDPRPRFYV